jgi:hypothetical protein
MFSKTDKPAVVSPRKPSGAKADLYLSGTAGFVQRPVHRKNWHNE